MQTPLLANRMVRWLAAAAIGLLATTGAQAQVTGTQAIPSATYPTLASAIAALNTSGVGAGGTTFNIASGYTETFASPTAGALTATGTSANPIVFQKSGTGANPVITAGVGTSTTLDAIISLSASDFVTFSGIDLSDPTTNATATTAMEFGFLLGRTGTGATLDGCNNITIRNSTITLQRAYTNTTNNTPYGIFSTAGTVAVPFTVLSPTSATATGQSSNNVFQSNTIQNVNGGIYLQGLADATPYTNYDQNNSVGSAVSGTGNTVQNFGGAATQSYGIRLQYQNGVVASYNTVANAAGGGVVSANTLYGIYLQSGTNTTSTANNNTVTLVQGTNASQLAGIYNATSGTGALTMNSNTFSVTSTASTGTFYNAYNSGSMATVTLNNNTVAYTATGAATNSFYAIYNTGTATGVTSLTGNTFLNAANTVASTGSTYFLYNSNSSTGPINVQNNQFSLNKTGTGGTIYGYFNGASPTGTHTIDGNTFSNITLVGAATFYGVYLNTSTSQLQNITNNTVSSVVGGSGSTYGIYSPYGANNSVISGNVVTALSGTGTTYGLATSTSFSGGNVFNNRVNAISTSGASSTVYGMSLSSTTNNVNWYRNKVYDISASGATGVAYGMYVAGGTTNTIYNNLIGNITAPASSGTTQVAGLYISSSTNVNAYFNTIYLNASSTGTDFGTAGIYAATAPLLDLRNNIVVNNSTPNGAGLAVAYRRSSTTLTTYASTSNNNLFYAGTPSATRAIYYDGTNTDQTLTAYKIRVSARDAASVTENPPFLSTTGADATFLHINTTTGTQVESGGAPVTGITTDYDGDTRNTTTPDLGADEGTFTPLDLSGPAITYTALANTASTTNRTLTATITDPSGVATGANAPLLFYRKGTSGTYISAAATSVSGSAYTFTIDNAALGGVTAGDVVQYYIAAKDALGNASTSPLGGTYTTSPATPNQYLITGTLAGIYYVGTSTSPNPARTYATLTAAATAYNVNALGGAVTFVLLDATYSTAETFPIIFTANADASATNTLTIKPNTGVTPLVTGSVVTGAVLMLNGADYITIDGSNTAAGTTQDLTIENASATGSGNTVLWVAAASATDGANFNTVKNTVIRGNSGTGFPQFTVFVGGGGAGVTAPTTSTPSANSNNTFTNNAIYKGYYGVFLYGTSATVLDQNNSFIGNQIGQTVAANGFGLEGMRAVFQQNLLIQGNEIQNAVNAAAASHFGLNLSSLKGSTITRNSIHNIQSNSTTSGYVGYGIELASTAFNTSTNASANTISNNLIYNISAPLASTSSNPNVLGIANNGGYGDKIYSNTVLLNVAQTAGTGYSAAISNGDAQFSTASSALDVRNNIFAITANVTTAAKYFGFYTSAANVTGSTLDYNDYYIAGTGTATFFVGNLSGTTLTSSATLAAWRTATSQEAHSVSADPQFVQTTTVPFNLTPTSALLNNVADATTGVTVDFTGATRGTLPDIGAYEFTPPSCQAVTGLAFATVTSTTASITFTAPTGGAGANSYTVTYTPAGGTATTITPNPTASPVAISGLTPSTVYTVTVTTNCTGATSPSATGTFTTLCSPPVYAALPVTEGFESTWISRCDTREVPTANWLNTPTTGNPSWRREDDGAAANWTSPTLGAYTPTGSQGSSHSARFHSYYAASGAIGTFDLYADLSAAGPKRLTFDYVNVSTGGSKIEVLLSTDGGATFSTTPLLTVTTAATFTAQTLDLTATSATSVIRFKATSDFGSYDIGVDNVQLRVLPAIDLAATALATPTSTQGCYGSAETVAVTVTNQGAQALDFSVNPATVTAVVTTPSGSQTLTGSIATGTLAAGATQNVTLAPTLNMTAIGTYSFAITATVTGDGNTANDLLAPAPTRTVAAPVAGTLAPAATSICISGTASLTLTGAANGSIQYQSSTSATGTFTDIAGATSATFTTPVLTSTTYYRAQVRCGTSVATSNVSTITVNNPLVATTNTPVAICAGSTATLTATASTGSTVRFFSAATGGTALATAGSYTTPALTANTTYYAEAFTGGQENVGAVAFNSTGQTPQTGGALYFTTTGPATIANVTVYLNAAQAAGTVTIDLRTGSSTSGSIVNSQSTAFAVPAGPATGVAPYTIPLNYSVPAAGQYTLHLSAASQGGLLRDNTGANTTSYPYTSPSGVLSITGASVGGYYYYFYNLQVGSECASAARTPIQVNVTQPATASFPAATATTCGASAYTLGGTVGGSVTTGTYTSSGTGTFAPNATTLGATYTPSAADIAAGSVTITLTSATPTSCAAATATLALSISPAPVATFSYPAATTYCAGSTSTVTPTLSTGATAGTFSSTTGLTIDAATGVITLSTSTAGTYTVTNTVAASGACAAATATATVTITPATTATFSYGSGTFCVSGSNPTATVTGTAGGTFSSTTGLTINATTGAITLSSTTPGTYTVTYSVAGSCASSSTQSVTITTAPVATFSYGTTPTFCVSGTNPAPSFGTGASAGTFTSTAGLTINATTGVITLASSTPGTYTVTNSITAASGCAAATATATVTITAAPLATFSYPAATTGNCAGSTGTVAATLGTGASAGTFTSTTGLTINATTGAVNLATSTAGTYTVTNTVAAAGGCAAATATATITVNPTPVRPTLSATYTSTTATLTSSAATGNQFYLGGVLIPGATGTTYVVNGGTPAQLGSYTVVVTNSFGCSSQASLPLIVTGTKNSIAGASVRVYPNPTPTGQVTLELSGFRVATQLTVFDALGRVITSELLPANGGVTTHALDLSKVATGVYTLRLTNTDGVETRRLVRE